MSTLQNLKTAAAGLHGAGEALRGTFNSTVDRHLPFGNTNADAMEKKNQAAIEAGRYEVAHRRFYRPDDVQHVQQDHGQPGATNYTPTGGGGGGGGAAAAAAAVPRSQEQQAVPATGPADASGKEQRGLLGRASASRLGNFINIAANRPTSGRGGNDVAQQQQPESVADKEKTRPRARLQKRSSSKLSIALFRPVGVGFASRTGPFP
ncbi:uncharacterized protein PG986_011486 [Apiospora aurea]|uniref:SMP domain-containing protein n=1 Tax=Apiospora aurea TaxID=335848 RepID=A0ABR1PX96_9PEZI